MKRPSIFIQLWILFVFGLWLVSACSWEAELEIVYFFIKKVIVLRIDADDG
jgi:hypothetical protein